MFFCRSSQKAQKQDGDLEGPEESRVSTEIWATRGPRGWRRGPYWPLSWQEENWGRDKDILQSLQKLAAL